MTSAGHEDLKGASGMPDVPSARATAWASAATAAVVSKPVWVSSAASWAMKPTSSAATPPAWVPRPAYSSGYAWSLRPLTWLA